MDPKVVRTMRPTRIRLALALFGAIVLRGSPFAPGQLVAQPPRPVSDGTSGTDSLALERFARIHLVIQGLRDREHVELADLRNKKPEVHQEIRARYAKARAKALADAGMADTAFTGWTRRLSADDGLRGRFDALLSRLGAAK